MKNVNRFRVFVLIAIGYYTHASNFSKYVWKQLLSLWRGVFFSFFFISQNQFYDYLVPKLKYYMSSWLPPMDKVHTFIIIKYFFEPFNLAHLLKRKFVQKFSPQDSFKGFVDAFDDSNIVEFQIQKDILIDFLKSWRPPN